MKQKLTEHAKVHTSESPAKKSSHVFEDLSASLDDLSTLTVYLEAAQALLQEQPIDVMDISAMLERAINACQRSEEKQRAMLSYVRKGRKKQSARGIFEFETTKDGLCSEDTFVQLFTLSIR